MEDSPTLPPSLASALIPSAPPSTYYIPSFLTPSEQAHLLHKINSVPLPTWRHLSHRRLQAHPSPLTPSNTLLAAPLPSWLHDPIIPRLLSIPLSPSSSPSSGVENIFSDSPHKAPNHCLINEYTPGQGISPHEDGGAYAPVVATVSLGAPIVLDVYRKPEPGEALAEVPEWRILQEPGSLLVSMGEMYEGCLHGITGVEVDEGLCEVREDADADGRMKKRGAVNWHMLSEECRGRVEENGGRWKRETRLSLTFRDVVRVKSLGKKLGSLAAVGTKY